MHFMGILNLIRIPCPIRFNLNFQIKQGVSNTQAALSNNGATYRQYKEEI
jgi:hypothetical protein